MSHLPSFSGRACPEMLHGSTGTRLTDTHMGGMLGLLTSAGSMLWNPDSYSCTQQVLQLVGCRPACNATPHNTYMGFGVAVLWHLT